MHWRRSIDLFLLGLLFQLLLFVVFGKVAVLAEALRVVRFFGVASAPSLRNFSVMVTCMAHALCIYLFVLMGALLNLLLDKAGAQLDFT